MRGMTIILLTVLLSSCHSYTPQNQQGKRFDANASVCKQLLNNGRQLYRVANHVDTATFSYTNFPVGFVTISDQERNLAANRYSQECETPSAYNKRQQIDLNAPA